MTNYNSSRVLTGLDELCEGIESVFTVRQLLLAANRQKFEQIRHGSVLPEVRRVHS